MTPRRAATASLAAQVSQRFLRFQGLALAVFALVLVAAQARAEDEMIHSHGYAIFGDLKYPADFKHLDYVNPDAPKGGEMSMWASGSFDSMNPYTLKGRAAALSSMFFESLLTDTADEIGASYGLLAESLDYPKDLSEVTFHLRPEAHFSDGSPVTAEDVVFSYNLLLAKGLPSFRAQLELKVESAEAVDERTVRYVFKKDVPSRDLIIEVGGLPVFSKAFYEANNRDFEESSLKPLVGSGPYLLDRLDVGQSVVYKRDPNYWGRDLPINVGRNNFDSIRVEYYADYNSAFEGFKGGTYTFRNEASSIIWATGYDFPAIHSGAVKKVELPNGNKATGQAWVFNLRREKFHDPRVREAIALMFNFEWSNRTLFYGIYDRVNSFWDNSYLAAEGLPSPEELKLLEPLKDILPEGVLTEPAYTQPVSGESQLDRRNLRRASQLLDEAGWLVGNDGMRRKDGQLLTVEFVDDSQTFDRVVNPFVDNLRRLGVDARYSRIDNAQLESRTRPPAYDFDIANAFMSTSYIPGSELRQFFGSETADVDVFNQMGLKNEAVDRLIDDVIAAETQEQLTTAVHALDRTLRAIKFWIPQWNKNTYTVAYYDIFDHPDPLPPYALGNLDFWWYDADKAAALQAAGAL